ncbi:MAG TPA: hypothetical protein DDW50_19515 [Firmicutes bacterium]|nr:hypothetical protein [Bacillota bacterium]
MSLNQGRVVSIVLTRVELRLCAHSCGLSTGNYMRRPKATAVFHPRKEAALFGVRASNDGVVYRAKRNKSGPVQNWLNDLGLFIF